MKKDDKKNPLIEQAMTAIAKGESFSDNAPKKLTPEEIANKKQTAFLSSAILSAAMLYNVDELVDLGYPKHKFMKVAKMYQKELTAYLDKIFDINSDMEAAKFIELGSKNIETYLNEYCKKD